MSYFSEMEWNTRWGWENLVAYGSKPMDSPKTNWMMVDEAASGAVSFNLSVPGNNGVVSGSDGGNSSSGKSSVSASTDSSARPNPNCMFKRFDGSSLNFSEIAKIKAAEASKNSLLLESSVGYVEPVIGLKLGKRTYFENSENVRSTTLSAMPTPSTAQKKTKSMCKNASIPHCQVEGCNIDLSQAKEYHQKHRVCDVHAKSSRVIIGGQERRFCQQCSRFHSLAEFDERKRSCRKRLSDHNARRRKPSHETIQFNSPMLSAPFYEGRQQLSFLMNNSAYTHSVAPASSTWDDACNSKFTLTKDYPLRSSNNGGTDEQLRMSGNKLSHLTMHSNSANTLLSSKNFKHEVLSPDSRGPVIRSSHVDAAPAYRRALSLLSNNSCGSYAPDSVLLQHHPLNNIKDPSSITQPTINAISETVPFSCSDLWATGQHITQPRVNYQGIPFFETPYEGDFYSNVLKY